MRFKIILNESQWSKVGRLGVNVVLRGQAMAEDPFWQAERDDPTPLREDSFVFATPVLSAFKRRAWASGSDPWLFFRRVLRGL